MRFLLRVLLKGLMLFLVINLLVGWGGGLASGRLSLYNHAFPGRPRFPFGESPREAYNFSLFDLDAMIASHALAGRRGAGEFRVLVLGDSSVWGTLLKPEETLAGQLNAKQARLADGRPVRFYNLGYPTLSLTKDLMVLDAAMPHRPDAVLWLVTLEAFPREKQLAVPLVENNPQRAARLIRAYGLDLDPAPLRLPTFWENTLVGRRKPIADWIRLQLYGVMWAATGIDQLYPTDYPPAAVDLEAETVYYGREDWGAEVEDDLALQTIRAAQDRLAGVPLLLVNEPILISQGKNSDVRYNFYYPRWAYDRYRGALADFTRRHDIPYLDVWDRVAPGAFTNSAIHIDRQGVAVLAGAVFDQLQAVVGPLQTGAGTHPSLTGVSSCLTILCTP